MRAQFGWVELVVAASLLVLFYLAVKVGQGTTVSFTPDQPLNIDTDPAKLPYDAGRSLLRMFAALGLSTLFTFIYAYTAARSRRLEKVLRLPFGVALPQQVDRRRATPNPMLTDMWLGQPRSCRSARGRGVLVGERFHLGHRYRRGGTGVWPHSSERGDTPTNT